MSFPRYPKYKDSGVEWLGQVPVHWEVTRLKWLCAVLPSNVDKKSHEGETPVRLCNYTDVYYNAQITTNIDFMAATASSEQITRFTLRAGDTIVTKDSETADDIAVSALVPVDLPGVVCGYHLALVRPLGNTVGGFIKFFFDAAFAKSSFAVRANGLTRVGLGQHELENADIAAPSRDEQIGITAFLDRETGKIDGLIDEQQQLIELLKKKRQATISHAVTKGLNLDAPMKPSGIDWLGDVPEHWDIVPLKRDVEFVTSGSRGWADNYSDSGDLFIRISNLTRERLDLDLTDLQRVSVPQDAEEARTRVRGGDVLFSITAYLGSVAVVPAGLGTAYVSQHVALVRPRSRHVLPYWLGFVALSSVGQTWFRTRGYGGTKVQLSLDDIRGLPVTVPPLNEQRAIVGALNRELLEFDSLITEAQRAIDLLHERRTALISAAVTGQIDVRGLAPSEAA
jgi:type I restriction enzyme S subunit